MSASGPLSRAELSVEMAKAITAGQDWPPDGVPDTPANRALWDEIKASDADMRSKGIKPDIPADWAAWPE